MILSESYKNRLNELAGLVSEADNRKVIVDKIGLSKEMADWAHNLSEKYSIWIANQIKKFNLDKSSESDFRKILDWKKANQEVNLNKFDFKSALDTSDEWHQEQFKVQDIKLGDKDVFLKTGPYFWVQLTTEEDCAEEGLAMGHCIGGTGHAPRIAAGTYKAFSMRDSNNNPHITIEINPKKEIIEFKGKKNEIPNEKYLPYAFEFLLKNIELWDKITDVTFEKFFEHSFKNLPDKTKEQYMKSFEEMISKGKFLELEEYHIPFLSPEFRGKYIFNLARKKGVISDYYFTLLTPEQKEKLIISDESFSYNLSTKMFNLLTPEQKMVYALKGIKRGQSLSDDKFKLLTDEQKKYFTEKVVEYPNRFVFISEIQFLTLDNEFKRKWALKVIGTKENIYIDNKWEPLLYEFLTPEEIKNFTKNKLVNDGKTASDYTFFFMSPEDRYEYVETLLKQGYTQQTGISDKQFDFLTPEKKEEYSIRRVVNSGYPISDAQFKILTPESKGKYALAVAEANSVFSQFNFDLLPNEFKKQYVNIKLNKGQSLSEKYFELLSPKKRFEYAIKRSAIPYGDIENTQFMLLSPKEREAYAINRAQKGYSISKEKFLNLTPEVRKIYAINLVNSGTYDLLASDEIKLLSPEAQIEYKEALKKHGELKEVRNVIKNTLIESIKKKTLKNILDSNEAYSILDSTDAGGSTWSSGGCAILSFALNKAYGYPVYVIYDNELKQADHFVVKTPNNTFVDCDGERENIISSFKELEGLQHKNLSLVPYNASINTPGIVFDDKASQQLADLIKNSKKEN